MPIPSDLPLTIARAINKAAESNIRSHEIINDQVVKKSNSLMDVEVGSIWYRSGNTLVQLGMFMSILRYVVPFPRRILSNIAKNTRAKAIGGWYKFRQAYARARNTTTQWLRQTVTIPGVRAHPHVPASSWENELASICCRGLPAPIKPVIDPKITAAAMSIAKKIGKITDPMSMDDWLRRFPPSRQLQLRRALDCPYNTSVEFFHKIEKLDEDKVPRAIQSRHDAFKARLGPWIAQLEERARQVLPLIKGLDDRGKALRVNELRSRANNVIEIDYSKFDRHCSLELLVATEQLVYEHCLPAKIASLMADQLNSTVSTRLGSRYKVLGTRFSGDVNTSIGNCIINLSLSMAAGIPIDALLVEGDDMVACITNKELATLDTTIISKTGHQPVLRVNPEDSGSFCSRYDVIADDGPRRVRHPVRDISRFGWALHTDNVEDIIGAHYHEWKGVPMLGPVYEEIMQRYDPTINKRTITAAARAQFHLVFGIDAYTQIKFETDPSARQAIYLAAEEEYTQRDDHDKVQGTSGPSHPRDENASFLSRGDKNAPPGLKGPDVRDVSHSGANADRVSHVSINNHPRRGDMRNRFRPKRPTINVQWFRRSIPKSGDPRVEECNPGRQQPPSDETALVQHMHTNQLPFHRRDRRCHPRLPP